MATLQNLESVSESFSAVASLHSCLTYSLTSLQDLTTCWWHSGSHWKFWETWIRASNQDSQSHCCYQLGCLWAELGVRPLVLQKLVLCIPFLHGWCGTREQQILASAPRGHEASASSGTHSEALCPESWMKLGARAPAAPWTGTPGRSAQAESTQGSLPPNFPRLVGLDSSTRTDAERREGSWQGLLTQPSWVMRASLWGCHICRAKLAQNKFFELRIFLRKWSEHFTDFLSLCSMAQ